MMRIALVAAALALTMVAGSAQAELIRKQSPYSVAETADRFEGIVKSKDLTVFNRIDHAGGAKKVGKELRPTVLIIFGSPAVGAAAQNPCLAGRRQQGLGHLRETVRHGGRPWLAGGSSRDQARHRRDRRAYQCRGEEIDGKEDAKK